MERAEPDMNRTSFGRQSREAPAVPRLRIGSPTSALRGRKALLPCSPVRLYGREPDINRICDRPPSAVSSVRGRGHKGAMRPNATQTHRGERREGGQLESSGNPPIGRRTAPYQNLSIVYHHFGGIYRCADGVAAGECE